VVAKITGLENQMWRKLNSLGIGLVLIILFKPLKTILQVFCNSELSKFMGKKIQKKIKTNYYHQQDTSVQPFLRRKNQEKPKLFYFSE